MSALLSPKDAAALTGRPITTIYGAVHRGALDAYKVGRCIRFDPEALARWAANPKPKRTRRTIEQTRAINCERQKSRKRSAHIIDAINRCDEPGAWRVYLRVRRYHHGARQLESWEAWPAKYPRPAVDAICALFVSVYTDGSMSVGVAGTISPAYREVVALGVRKWKESRA